jgi:hypothetical protein
VGGSGRLVAVRSGRDDRSLPPGPSRAGLPRHMARPRCRAEMSGKFATARTCRRGRTNFGLVWTTAYRWMVDTVATRPTTAHFFFAAPGHDYPRARSSPASTGVHNYERVHYLLGLIFYRFAFAKFIIYMICISPLRIRPEPRRISISSRPSLRPAFYSIPSGWLTFLDRNIPLHRGPTT